MNYSAFCRLSMSEVNKLNITTVFEHREQPNVTINALKESTSIYRLHISNSIHMSNYIDDRKNGGLQ